MPAVRLLRSVLYVPGSNERALRKSAVLPTDAVILDLEDPVAPSSKQAARENVAAHLSKAIGADRFVAVRINGSSTPWVTDDLAMVADCSASAVVIPKVNSIADLRHVRSELDRRGAAATRLWAMVETTRCLLALPELAEAAREGSLGLDTLVVGVNDLAKEAGASTGYQRAYLIPWLMQIVAAGRAGRAAVLDGVFNDFADTTGFAEECAVGRACGFDGKTLIHPNQIAVANSAFSPTPEEIEDAEAVVRAFDAPENIDAAVVVIAGRMVERLHLDQARTLLARSEAAQSRRTGPDTPAGSS